MHDDAKGDAAMQPEIRRIIAVEAHRRRSGHCALRVHSLGTGETFDIRPTDDGFVDLSSHLKVSVNGEQLLLTDIGGAIDLRMIGDVEFGGFDHLSNQPFSGRAGGGASVTLYDRGAINYFQYAVVTDGAEI